MPKHKLKKAAEQVVRHKHHYIIATLCFLALFSLSALALSYFNWTTSSYVKQNFLAIFDSQGMASKYREQARIAAIQQAEAAAKAKIQAEAQAKAQSEATIAAQANAATSPVATVSCDVTQPSSVTVIVNKKHCFKVSDWAPTDLAPVNGYYMRQVTATNLQNMIKAAEAEGVAIDISSAYRSYQNQVDTYNNWVSVNGSTAAADTVSARPGYSEHQTGLAVDLKTGGCALECFAGSSSYTWLKQHASSYGFIERYPSGLSAITGYAPEAWHWRYVGAATAQNMKAKNIQTLEEYLGVTGGSY